MVEIHSPEPKSWREKIGDREMLLPEQKLNVFKQITLWSGNPRLQPFISEGNIPADVQLEAALRETKGYDVLRQSIANLGQMEPVYAWKRGGTSKFLVLEGATRVTVLRDLVKKYEGKPEADQFRYVTAKILPQDFSETERVILLARIHVRGTGVRSWGRYVEAKFVHDGVTEQNGHAPLMTISDLARYMGKSISWVQRLKDAYTFSQAFVQHIDNEEAEKMAAQHFSTLEEISKSTNFGPKVRDYENREYNDLRQEVFEMVRNDVFKEYRDARFMKQFYDDPEKWEQLKTHERHIANKLAAEEKQGGNSLASKIAALPNQIERALRRRPDALGEESLEYLNEASRLVASHFSDAGEFRLHLREFTKALSDVPLSQIKAVTPEEYKELMEGIEDFTTRIGKHKSWNDPI